MFSNRFELAHAQRGTLSQAQEKALTNFAITLGRERFSQYRQQARVDTPIPRMSKAEAWRLIRLITQDLGAKDDTHD